MKRLILIFAGLFFTILLSSHPWKPSHYVIIDTDGGVDDMRAISMLLASHDVRVLAITISPGALSADNAYIKVKSLLNSYYHEGIPVGINRKSNFKSPEYNVALQTIWGDEKNIVPGDAPDYLSVISYILSAEKSKISFISLGSMSTARMAMQNIPSLRGRIKDFIWSADGESDTQGFNYNIDKTSSVSMLKQEIPVKIVRRFSQDNGKFYTADLIRSISEIKTPYAEKITLFFSSESAKNHDFTFSGTDDMTPVFLHYPELFLCKTAYSVSDCNPSDAEEIKKSVLKILKGETVAETQIMKRLPLIPDFYTDDIQPVVDEIIKKHGHDEWFSGVIASEMHRHLGVFEIIGVKMGIRAREYFNTGVDEFTIVSFAGSTPPLSCMNDGLQVATGATTGHGLLTIRNDTILSPSVEIKYMNKKIRVSLKKEIAEKIGAELKEINYIYGLDSNIYWELVRKNTIKYWKEMDRHEIFLIEELY